MENYDISVILRMKREALGYTRAKVCELCNHIFSEKTLYRMETGRAKMSRHTIKTLLELYNQPSHSICAVMDMESYTMQKLYNEVLGNLFLEEYAEANRKLNLLEQYVRGESEVVERLKKEVQFFSKKTVENNTVFNKEMETLLKHIIPEKADISKWPLLDMELASYTFFFVVLTDMDMDDSLEWIKKVELLMKLLANIKQNYHGIEIKTDYSGIFAKYLLHVIPHRDAAILKLAEEALDDVILYGNICNTYILLSLMFQRISKSEQENNDYWIEKLKKAYYLSLSIEDMQYANCIKSILKSEYNVAELY